MACLVNYPEGSLNFAGAYRHALVEVSLMGGLGHNTFEDIDLNGVFYR